MPVGTVGSASTGQALASVLLWALTDGNSTAPKSMRSSKVVTMKSTTACRLLQRVTSGVTGSLSASQKPVPGATIEPDLSSTSMTRGMRTLATMSVSKQESSIVPVVLPVVGASVVVGSGAAVELSEPTSSWPVDTTMPPDSLPDSPTSSGAGLGSEPGLSRRRGVTVSRGRDMPGQYPRPPDQLRRSSAKKLFFKRGVRPRGSGARS